ncbi:HlyD family efflux transporter periplasmic adaptor subunit [Dyella flava]|uniref:HlyD family efflux transporter periplasmic adaptor subunit n=1 Tax=Dyella flava TaxID=1920170 RepID=A0ABS2K1N0_9GAMM|nr:HlyD family efflux transporter periplasmic adaptor subunit [Dyella flava]MBM7125152.1 HlyD family efflux transporter periplasmic adaptor subunit [Dyella flava]GLQ52026.1 multidrug resistance protein [Dyella flava]
MNAQASSIPVEDGGQASNRRRRGVLALITLGVAALAAAAAAYYLLVARYYESTDDAYVNGNVVQVTPQVTGTVIAVNADNTQTIQQGQPLVKLDPADARIALQQAEATLGQTVRQVHTLYVDNLQYRAVLAQRKADLARAQEDYRRRMDIAQSGAVSTEEITHARDALSNAQAAYDAANQQLAANQALTWNVSIANHPDVLAAAAKVRDAYLAYARNTLPAPVTGYVAQRVVQVGQRVAPGTPLMAVVPLNEIWVDANFKEVQLEHMRVGQPVTLHADVYGSSVTYHGRVVGFSAGTGSAFSLLPPQNATGNWIKIVQRLPVRIALAPKELEAHPLRIGLSVIAEVDLHNENGAALDNAPNTVYQTPVFADYGVEAEGEIARIIAQNAGDDAEQTVVAAGTLRDTQHVAMAR